MEVVERIKSTLASHPIVLFMKGTPQFPMCGFSSRTAQALKAVNADYHSVNVLEDPEIRANLPRYSNWPTFPQLFIHGELIGGCDITMELYEHCLPFNVARAYDEALGIDNPRVWTAERDKAMWQELQG